MITLILGAGASQPYGLPSGRELVTGILDHLRSGESRSVLRDAFDGQIQESFIQEFGRALEFSRLWSIDAFLETRREFAEVGKAAIALTLLPREEESSLGAGSPGGGNPWYDLLWNKLHHADVDGFPAFPVSIVTLNYDRSVEQYFFEAIQNAYGRDPEEASGVLSRIDIGHMHGSLGALPWEGGEVKYGNPSDSRDFPKIVRAAAESISLAHEPENETFVAEANDIIANSDWVYFIGCSYHVQYMKRFTLVQGGNYAGTCLDMAEAELQDVNADYPPLMLRRQHAQYDALAFLRHIVSFRSARQVTRRQPTSD
jgi:hypothetical protein